MIVQMYVYIVIQCIIIIYSIVFHVYIIHTQTGQKINNRLEFTNADSDLFLGHHVQL